MIYADFRTKSSIVKFLSEFLNIDKLEVRCMLDIDIDLFDTNEIYKKHFSGLKYNNINEIRLVLNHITTSGDGCKDIKKHGLMNLKDLLKFENSLTKELLGAGFEFDIDNGIIKYKGNKYKLIGEDLKEGIRKVSNKIYDDNMICGFLGNVNTPSMICRGCYPFSRYPEFYKDLDRVFHFMGSSEFNHIDRDLYVVEYTVNIKDIPAGKFCEETEIFNDKKYEDSVSKHLINKAIIAYRYYSEYNSDYDLDLLIYVLKENINIRKENINIYTMDEYKNKFIIGD